MARAVAILRCMAEGTESHGVREIASKLDMTPSTASRTLASLRREGLVDERDGRLFLGLELARLGRVALEQLNVKEVARDALVDLAEQTEESVRLAVYDPARRMMLRIDSIPSSKPLQYIVPLNEWTPIFRGASGLAILAFLPDDEVTQVLEEAESTADEGVSWVGQAELRQQLTEIRARGYACTHGRRIAGAVGIAAPFFDTQGRVMGDVILTVPEVRFRGRLARDAPNLVVLAADRVTEALGGRKTR